MEEEHYVDIKYIKISVVSIGSVLMCIFKYPQNTTILIYHIYHTKNEPKCRNYQKNTLLNSSLKQQQVTVGNAQTENIAKSKRLNIKYTKSEPKQRNWKSLKARRDSNHCLMQCTKKYCQKP